MGWTTYAALLMAAVVAAGCGKKPKNVIVEWKDEGNGSRYSVEALDEKARKVTITARGSTTILTGDGEGDDPDTAEVTIGGNTGYFGGAGQPPIPPSSKPSYGESIAEAGRRLDERFKGASPTPAAPAAPADPTPEPEPNVLYGPKPLGDADNVTLEALSDGTMRLKYVKGDLTWVLNDKDRDMKPETGTRTVAGFTPGGSYGPEPGQMPLPSKAESLYERTMVAIADDLGAELDAFYPSPPAPVAPAAPGPDPAPAAPAVPAPGPDPAPAAPAAPGPDPAPAVPAPEPATSGGSTTSLDYVVDYKGV